MYYTKDHWETSAPFLDSLGNILPVKFLEMSEHSRALTFPKSDNKENAEDWHMF